MRFSRVRSDDEDETFSDGGDIFDPFWMLFSGEEDESLIEWPKVADNDDSVSQNGEIYFGTREDREPTDMSSIGLSLIHI